MKPISYTLCVLLKQVHLYQRDTQRIMLTSPKIAPDAPTDGAVHSA